MIALTLSGAKNSAGDIVPAFIRAKLSMAFWLPWTAARSCCISGGGGCSVAVGEPAQRAPTTIASNALLIAALLRSCDNQFGDDRGRDRVGLVILCCEFGSPLGRRVDDPPDPHDPRNREAGHLRVLPDDGFVACQVDAECLVVRHVAFAPTEYLDRAGASRRLVA